ncbi:MAG: hypothetical protein ACI4OA_00540 [Selenomonadaceae bacterium]
MKKTIVSMMAGVMMMAAVPVFASASTAEARCYDGGAYCVDGGSYCGTDRARDEACCGGYGGYGDCGYGYGRGRDR